MAPIRIKSHSPVDLPSSTPGASTSKSGESRLSQRSSQQFDALGKRPSTPRPGPGDASSSSTPRRTDKPLPPVPPEEPAHNPPAADASAQRPAKPLPAVPGKPGDVHSFVPPKAESGGGFARFANMLGANRKGVHAVGLAGKKPMNNVLNAASSNEHGKFAYDAAPATELVNAAASGSTAIAAHNISKRYGNKVDDMLAGDVARFHTASSKAGTPAASLNQGLVDHKNLTPAQQLAFKRNPSIPENQLITKDAQGNWQYDKAKLTRIAKDTSHPDSTHARDVLATMSIAENKGKQRRGAALATLGSGIGVAATTAQIVGTHGAITPALVAGHAGLGGKETLELKKPFVEARQEMRNEKSDEVLRHVNRRMDGLPPLPEDAPIGVKAGAYAVAYENARRNVAQQNNFGFRIPGSMIDDRKSATVKSDAQELANKHISGIVQNGMKRANDGSLARLGNVDKELGLTRSQREKRALEHISGDADLKAVHTLLTDTGIPKGEAAMLMSKMSEHSLAARNESSSAPAKASDDAKPLTRDEERTKIADIIGEPTLKPADTVKDAEGKIKSGLALRS
ncbi:hypothetical protein G3N95_24865 [Paraburkholderia sp. Tr-20389]|uniref:hypothetical protein n=1 Tax=Paraburkholderia sp. Tr-20389 TaxID=2703903 RepID=UPI00197F21B1|nr:hypothetical protein [Paraburkholderia sp. Tr-20389]MBN3756195.1 hypothetical protein [Paraburkholderia sp. Tr-20389]